MMNQRADKTSRLLQTNNKQYLHIKPIKLKLILWAGLERFF